MNHITIKGIKPYDGRYELDLDQDLTTRELGWLKRFAGYLPLALTEDAFGDPEVWCVFAVIALRRVGRVEINEVPALLERFADAPFGPTITIEGDQVQEEEEQELPPPPRRLSSNGVTSGTASPPNSGTPETHPKRIGMPGSATSAFAPPTSAT